MRDTEAVVGSVALAASAFAALSASAEIKYWDNPAFRAFDVDCYVQDGLVMNYDGIRNAGPNADHDPEAMTWVNCANPGTYDMTRYSTNGTADNSKNATSAAWNNDASKGSWTEKGFVFGKDAIFHESARFVIPATYTIQTLVDATAGDQNGIGYVMCDYNAANWAQCCLGIRKTAGGGTPDNSIYLVSSQRPYFTAASDAAQISYATVIHDNTEGVIFAGTKAPWDATDGSYRSDLATGPYVRENGISLGGHYPRTDEMFNGTIKAFRFYTTRLSEDDVAWNRVVDEARYFGRTAALPVTNAVVASNIPIVGGNEPSGCYAVDGSHVFSAPASKVVKGRTYTLDGFTVETWNGSAWGVAVLHTGETSYTATDDALVRLTWRWTAGDGLVAYDADDYVQDGLVLHYDGIRNAGLGAAHDSAATVWVNVANPGSGDLVRYSLASGVWQEGAATGSWTDDGFVFSKNALFHHVGSFTIPTRYTTQAVFDAKQSDQDDITYIVCPSPDGNGNDWQRWSVGLRKTSFNYGDGSVANVLFYCATDAAGGRLAERGSSDRVYNYATAMLDVTNAVVFTGTTAPWTAAGASYGHRVKTGTSSALTLTKGFSLAGHYSTASAQVKEMMKGTIHDFRFYNRVLSDDEVVWNRIVDEARYFAKPNVVVASTRADVQANEADGEYGVVGSYTFTAPERVAVGEITYAPAGYAIQQWDDAVGAWGAATECTGSSYAYTTDAGKVRLLWRWKAVSGLRTAADYDVSDYVAGGLVLNFDGIRNAGAAEGHDPDATTWVNLGTDGALRNATISKTTDLAWGEKGYEFDGTRKFMVKPASGLGTASHTVQLLTDAVQNDQQHPGDAYVYFFSGAMNSFAGATYSSTFYYRIQGRGGDPDLCFRPAGKDEPIGYATFITDAAAKKAYIFPGDAKPTTAPGVNSYETISTPAFDELAIGGWGGATDQYMKGTINYFRYYDRVLSDAELVHNRQVDTARYFGVLGVTNVFVVAGGGIQAEAGAYKVEGSWTFTATSTVNRRGETVPVERYSIETIVDGARTDKQIHNGSAYTYTEGSSPATIRLKWLGRPDGAMVIMQ